ncbi:MAG: hypothetical protein AAGC81_16390 [Pseudomonadota bacterium]
MFRDNPEIFDITVDIDMPIFDYRAEMRSFRAKGNARGVWRRDRFFTKGYGSECSVPRPEHANGVH